MVLLKDTGVTPTGYSRYTGRDKPAVLPEGLVLQPTKLRAGLGDIAATGAAMSPVYAAPGLPVAGGCIYRMSMGATPGTLYHPNGTSEPIAGAGFGSAMVTTWALSANRDAIYMFGLMQTGGTTYDVAKKFDVASRTWTYIASLPTPLVAAGHASRKSDGAMFLIGGLDTMGYTRAIVRYTPANNTMATLALTLPAGFRAIASRCFQLPGGEQALLLGEDGSALVFDAKTETLTTAPSLPGWNNPAVIVPVLDSKGLLLLTSTDSGTAHRFEAGAWQAVGAPECLYGTYPYSDYAQDDLAARTTLWQGTSATGRTQLELTTAYTQPASAWFVKD